MKFLLSSVVFDVPLREGEMTQADLMSIAQDYSLSGLELRDAYWQGGEAEINATLARAWEENVDIVYATGDVLVGKDLRSTLDGLSKMLQSVYLAAKMGGGILRINAGAIEENMAIMSDSSYKTMLDKIGQEAAEIGVVMALENPTQIGAGSIMTLNWIFTQYPFIKLTFDTANWLTAGEKPLTALEALAEHIVYIHLKDVKKEGQTWQFTYPGDGEVPFKEILSKLTHMNYDGYYAFEFSGGQTPRQGLAKAVGYIKGLGIGLGAKND